MNVTVIKKFLTTLKLQKIQDIVSSSRYFAENKN